MSPIEFSLQRLCPACRRIPLCLHPRQITTIRIRACHKARWGQRALEALLPSGDLTLLGIDRAKYSMQIGMAAVHMVVFSAVTLLVLWGHSQVKN